MLLRIHSAIASWIHSYFDYVMTKFMIKNRTDTWKTDVNLLNRWQSISIISTDIDNRWSINGEAVCDYWLVEDWRNQCINITSLYTVIVNTFHFNALNISRRTILSSLSSMPLPSLLAYSHNDTEKNDGHVIIQLHVWCVTGYVRWLER